MPFSSRQQLKAIRESKLLHGRWYLANYPDAAQVGMTTAEHYLTIGASLGRNPSRYFNTTFYFQKYLAGTKSEGVNPLAHYHLEGKDKGNSPLLPNNVSIKGIRRKLIGLGVEDEAISELRRITHHADPNLRAEANIELSLQALREGDMSHVTARAYINAALEERALSHRIRQRVCMADLLVHYFSGKRQEGLAAFNRALMCGNASPDMLLARANFEDSPEERVRWINLTLGSYNLSPVTLRGNDAKVSPYDRLQGLQSEVSNRQHSSQPKVSVLLAAYESPTGIETALRSLRDQTWKNLEIIVVDDASPSFATYDVACEFAKSDARINVLRLGKNGGAYIARNAALDIATGDYVTLHDADDWSHPSKIETQVKYLDENRDKIACTSEQARIDEELRCNRIRTNSIIFNTSSFMFRREPVKRELGYWDTVRFGADTEFIERVKTRFGNSSFVKLDTGPLSFQRQSSTSVTAGTFTGIDVERYGARRTYHNNYIQHHKDAPDLKYLNSRSDRPFPAPNIMLPDRDRSVRYFDYLIIGDVRTITPDLQNAIAQYQAAKSDEAKIGVIEVFENGSIEDDKIDPSATALLRSVCAEIIVYGDVVTYGTLLCLGNASRHSKQKYLADFRPNVSTMST